MKRNEAMTWVEHLEELRRRLIVSLGGLVVFTGIAYHFSSRLIHWLARPVGEFVFLAPAEAFLARLKIAVLCGAFCATPLVLFEAWRFVARGLTAPERKVLRWVWPSSFTLFALGVALALFGVVPLATRFLMAYGSADMRPLLSVDSYVGFVTFLTMSFGLLFQLPLALLFLHRLGLVTRDQLARHRRLVYVAAFVAAALLTPGPDVISQILLAVPTIVLYELSLGLLAWFPEGQKPPPRSGAPPAPSF